MDKMLALDAFDAATPSLELLSITCRVGTALIAAAIGYMTFRYTRRQNALTLVNHNNIMANLVHTTIIQSEAARDVFAKLQEPIVGSPDDAALFIYLNYVHNTFRMYQIKAVTRQVWDDTLASCATMMKKLRGDQVERLLAHGYETAFQQAVLSALDGPAQTVATVAAARRWKIPTVVVTG